MPACVTWKGGRLSIKPVSFWAGFEMWQDSDVKWMGADDSGLTVVGNNVQRWQVDGGPFELDWHGLAPIRLDAATGGITVLWRLWAAEWCEFRYLSG